MDRRPGVWLAPGLALLLAFGIVSLASGHPEDPGPDCKDGHGCAWKWPDFEDRGDSDGWKWLDAAECGCAGEWIGPGRPARSAKNRFNDRTYRLSSNPHDPDATERCLDPGENRRDFPVTDWVKMSEVGHRC